MEQAQMTTENLRNVMATVDAMQTANKEMKKQYKNVNIDKIDVRGERQWYGFKLYAHHRLTCSNYKMRWRI